MADASALSGSHVLNLLLSGEGLLRPVTAKSGDVDFRSVETYANVVFDQMNFLEASADFIRLGSVSQQKLYFAAKASALISYLNCSRLNEEAADSEALMTWLEDTLTDPVHMADADLASVVLKSNRSHMPHLPLPCINVSRLLPRFIVQSGVCESTIDTAAKCLGISSADALCRRRITTLYTLGNVLSPRAQRPRP